MEITYYDAKKSQRVPMQVEHNNELFDIAFQFEPLDDERILSFFQTEDSDDERDAAVKLFDATVVSAEGIEYDTKEDLIAIVKADDKREAIRQGLLGAIRKAPPKGAGKLNYRAHVSSKSYRLEAVFDGSEVETSIMLEVPAADHLRVHQALINRSFPVKFGDQQLHDTVTGLRALYKALYLSCTGYVDGIVPLHHQLLVIGFHLNGYRAVITKK